MSESGWREQVVTYIKVEAQPADKFGHQPRLYALAAQIASGERARGQDVDDDVIFASAWMHDLGVFLGHRPSDPLQLARWDHVPYTIQRSRDLLEEWGFPHEKLEAVAEAIRTHEAKNEPVTTEAVVLRDADILEQLGVVGALRALVKVGRDTRYQLYSDVIPVLERALRQLPEKLQTEVGRNLAEPRVRALTAFLRGIEEEAGAFLY